MTTARILRLVPLFACLFAGCRARPAPDSGFLQDPKLMTADKSVPFNRMYRNPKFKTPEGDMHAAADLTSQANHLGVTIQADIIKQKLTERNGGYKAVEAELGSSYGKTNKLVYEKLTTDNPIDLVRYQVANCYMGRCGLINSGGESKGASDLAEAVRTAVVNKRGGGMGLISGRKAFQRPMSEGVQLLNAIQDVYLADEITVA